MIADDLWPVSATSRPFCNAAYGLRSRIHACWRFTHVKVLLTDDDAERAGALARVLTADTGLSLVPLKLDESMAEAVASSAAGMALLDMGRPDRDAVDGLRRVATLNTHAVVMIVDEDNSSFMKEAISTGVHSYGAMGMPPPDVTPILRATVALFRRHPEVRDDLKHVEKRLSEQSVVDRAKTILIKQRRLSEPDAYKWVSRAAMSRERRIVHVASELMKATEGTRHE